MDFAAATWEDVRDRAATHRVAILPVGATEAHGPHLPLATDVIIAQAMAREGARRLLDRGVHAWILPPLSYTAAPFAAGFPGTISLRPETVTALLIDIGRGLAAAGVRTLAIANAHLDPTHLHCLNAALPVLAGDVGLLVAFPDLTRKPWGARLTDEFKTGACHAGRFEGSVVLAERADLVREEIRRDLAPNWSSLSDAIRAGRRTFAEAGGARAYFGEPAAATADEGRRTVAILGEILADAVLAVTPLPA